MMPEAAMKKTEEEKLERKLERLANRLEAMRIAEYLDLLENPKKLIGKNFIAGIARGVGFAVGTTIIFAIIVEVLRRIVLMKIPLIGDYLLEIIRLIELDRLVLHITINIL